VQNGSRIGSMSPLGCLRKPKIPGKMIGGSLQAFGANQIVYGSTGDLLLCESTFEEKLWCR